MSQNFKDMATFVAIMLVTVAMFFGGVTLAQTPGWEWAGTGLGMAAVMYGAFMVAVWSERVN